jgi:hypothetical protein
MTAITKEMALVRLELLQKELQAITESYNGAVQDCNYWISILDKEETNGETNTN